MGDAKTGWNSVSQIIIEEVSRAQSWLLPSFSYKEWWTILYRFVILAFKIFPHYWYPKVRNVLLFVTNIFFFSKHFPYFLCDCDTRYLGFIIWVDKVTDFFSIAREGETVRNINLTNICQSRGGWWKIFPELRSSEENIYPCYPH